MNYQTSPNKNRLSWTHSFRFHSFTQWSFTAEVLLRQVVIPGRCLHLSEHLHFALLPGKWRENLLNINIWAAKKWVLYTKKNQVWLVSIFIRNCVKLSYACPCSNHLDQPSGWYRTKDFYRGMGISPNICYSESFHTRAHPKQQLPPLGCTMPKSL